MRQFLYMSAQLRKTNGPLDLEVIVKQKRKYTGVTLGFTCTWGALQASETLFTCSTGKKKITIFCYFMPNVLLTIDTKI